MAETTPAEFIEALEQKGYHSRLALTRPEEPEGVNVWLDGSFVPTTTVWWPRPGHPTDQIVWGPNFDNTAHRDIPAESLVDRVVETSR